jgi:amino acid adenylation domain-containing protein/FkbH-like protein
LNERANQLAHCLIARGIGAGSLVGVCLNRSENLLVALFGIMKSGAAYLPLDPNYPQERLNYILDDAQASLVVTEEAVLQMLPALASKTLRLDSDRDEIAAFAKDNPPTTASPDGLAYVLHTSGSTGKPKGVEITQRNLVNFLTSMQRQPGLTAGDTLLAVTTLSFDIAGLELYLPLITGACVVISSRTDAIDPGQLMSLIKHRQVTVMQATPSTWIMLLEAGWQGDRNLKVLCGGESLSQELGAKLAAGCGELWNMYGPTETTIWSSLCRIPAAHSGPITIGYPIANTTMYVLDPQRQLVPVGVAGELYIGGDGVGRGYWKKPELTAERFLPDPFVSGARMYRTGDLAKYLPDGSIQCLGRIDHQVKIRGHRIELGEIETVLSQQDAVRECVVLAREDEAGDKRLVAYVVSEVELDPAVLRTRLREVLPEYMVPTAFVELERMPLSPNGKVDRKSLPAPSFVRGDIGAVVAATPTEETIAAIWADVLRLETAGVEDNFFEFGGHSLLATQVIARVSSACGVSIPLRCLFDSPTIRGVAAEVDKLRAGGKKSDVPALTRVDRSASLPLSFAQQRFWVMNQLHPDDSGYNIKTAIRITGPLDENVMRDCIAEVFARNEVLRTTYPVARGIPTQAIHPAGSASLEIVDIEEGGEPEALACAAAEAERPFDLSKGPVCRFLLYRVAALHHVLVMVSHHICMDGASVAILFEDLATLYAQLAAGEAPHLPPLRFDYADFAAWQRQWMQGEVLEGQLDFWRTNLIGIPASMELPVDHDVQTGSMAGEIRSLTLGSEFEEALAGFCHTQKVTQFAMMLGSLAILLHRWSAQRDFVIGTVTGNRPMAELERVFGCFLNMLPLRMGVSGSEAAVDVLMRSRETVLDGFAHGQCPFEMIVEDMKVERAPGRNPIFNIGLLLQNFSEIAFRTESLEGKGIAFPRETALLDLRFVVSIRDKKVRIACEYKRELFDAETIDLLLEGYSSVLQGIVHDAGVTVDAVPIPAGLLAQAEKRRQPDRTKLVISATFTAEPLEEPLNFWLRELEMKYEVKFAAYHQVFQQLLDPASSVRRNREGFNVLLVRFEDWQQFDGGDAAGARSGIRRNVEELISAVKAAAAENRASYILCCCPASRALAGDPEWAPFLRAMEERVAQELGQSGVVQVITPAQIGELYPVRGYEDKVAEAVGHVPYTTEFFAAMATMLIRRITGLTGPQYKVVVLDCDNTLWKGICGEDGPRGVVVDAHFSALQAVMRKQREAGMLLCLCSKNGEKDVWDVFEENPGMLLKREEISAYRVNWERKSTNLRSLAAELGLGLDSFVFLDDNPVECAEVEAECPEVLTLQLPEEAEQIPTFLKHVWAFDHFRSTDVDRRRGELYRENREREQLRQGQSLEEFIGTLELEVAIAALSEENIARVAQLTQRSNQFNCTTIRRQESQVSDLVSNESMRCLTVHLRDRFGDYGLIGAVIYGCEEDSLVVDTFLLSCRALGRRVEHTILDRLCEEARGRGLSRVDIRFSPTPKNTPALDFLEGIHDAAKVFHEDGVTYRVGVEGLAKGCASTLVAAV